MEIEQQKKYALEKVVQRLIASVKAEFEKPKPGAGSHAPL